MTIETVRVSYIISTRNRAKFLGEALRNVREFITPGDELIVVDGGSTDDTANVVAANRDLVTVFTSEPDFGEAHGYNKGIMAARGRFIKLLTDDDYIFPQAMRQAVTLLEENPQVDALICGGEFHEVSAGDGESRFVGFFYLPPGRLITDDVQFTITQVACGIGLVLTRRAIARVGLLDTTFHAVDTDYLARLIACKTDFRYAHLKLYRHTRHLHSASKFAHLLQRDHSRVLLRMRRWDVLGGYSAWHIGDALGLWEAPQGHAMSELIEHGEWLRRSRLRVLVRATALVLRWPFRLLRRISRDMSSSSSPTAVVDEREVGFDGVLR